MAADPRYSIVVPVYGNEETLADVVARMNELARRLSGRLEVVFVVDGSPDESLSLLRRLLPTRSAWDAQLISLSRNFGSFSAIKTGLSAARGELIAVMAADLQEPLTLLEDSFDRLDDGRHDVAVGVRTDRDDPALSLALSRTFWRTFRRFLHADMPKEGVDVFACSQVVARQLMQLRESHTSLIGLLFWVGFRRVEVPYVRQPRQVGKSGWSLRRKTRYFLDSVFSFTDVPVLLIVVIGAGGVAISSAVALVVFVAWVSGEINVAGYTPLMLALAFFASSILFSLGVIGSYVWRTYENTKARPHAIPMSHELYEDDAAEG